MSEIQRYTAYRNEMKPTQFGFWVTHDDAKAAISDLEAKLADRDEKLMEANTIISEIYDVVEGYADGTPDSTIHALTCNRIVGIIADYSEKRMKVALAESSLASTQHTERTTEHDSVMHNLLTESRDVLDHTRSVLKTIREEERPPE